jgi:hypothetical protein
MPYCNNNKTKEKKDYVRLRLPTIYSFNVPIHIMPLVIKDIHTDHKSQLMLIFFYN